MPLSVLITGFGPFPGAPQNPTGPLARRLAELRRPAFEDLRAVAHVLETSYAAVDRELPALIDRHRPDIVLLFGLAARTRHLRIETRARNRRSTLFPDVDGYRPEEATISAGAPGSVASRAPHRRLVSAARSTGIEARLSHDAGRYLCNFAYWRALQLGRGSDRPPLVQFVHVPMAECGPVPRPARTDHALAELVGAGEAILLALVAAARDEAVRQSASA